MIFVFGAGVICLQYFIPFLKIEKIKVPSEIFHILTYYGKSNFYF